MGKYFIDQFSLLHFSVGVICYFWNISLITFTIIHLIFEILENTKKGMFFINNYITFWPGGKPNRDTFINIIGDNVFAILGWLIAYFLNVYGKKYKWYY